jgi:hypothetical protein
MIQYHLTGRMNPSEGFHIGSNPITVATQKLRL